MALAMAQGSLPLSLAMAQGSLASVPVYGPGLAASVPVYGPGLASAHPGLTRVGPAALLDYVIMYGFNLPILNS